MPGWSIESEEGSILASGKLKGRFEHKSNMMWFVCEWNPSGCCFDNVLKQSKGNSVGNIVI